MIYPKDIEVAYERLQSFIHRTPILTNSHINSLIDAEVYFKCENLQKTGSFKARGATNSILKLSEEQLANGVATHSSGNHGQALAWAASQVGTPAYIVMPENAPVVKINAVKGYGAEVVFCESTLQAREEVLIETTKKTGAIFIPPFNYYDVIEGQATCAFELIDSQENLDYILAPVGGGGLLSGSALSAHYFSEGTKVVGCEPVQADDAYRSFKQGERQEQLNPNTIADGLRTSLGDITFGFIKDYVEDILLCDEEEIVRAMKLVWERMKIIIEPSCAVPVACLLKNKETFEGKKVGLVLTGGNVDLEKLPF